MAVTSDDCNPKLPSWGGDWSLFEAYELRVGLEVDSTKKEDLILLGPRLAKNLFGSAFELVEGIDREKLNKEDGPSYLLKYLKELRGRDRVDIMGDALRDLFMKTEVQRREGEEFSAYMPRFRHYIKAVDTALKDVNPDKKMPEEFYGWYLLTICMRLDPTDIANIKAKAESYSLRHVENAIKMMWSGGGLALRDQERKKFKSLGKAFVAQESSYTGQGEDSEEYEPVFANTAPDEPDDDIEQYEEIAAAFLEALEDEDLLIAFQEAKKKIQYKEARKMLTKSRTNRDSFPMASSSTSKPSKGMGKGKSSKASNAKEEVFHGDCMRCGKYGHKARNCPQKTKTGANYVGTSDDLIGVVQLPTDLLPIFATTPTGRQFSGILDSGASETIMGVETLQELYSEFDRLGFDPRTEIQVNRALQKSFVFGNSEVGQALGVAQLTIGLLGQEVQIDAHIVEGQTPLLLSAKFLMGHKVTIDRDTALAWFPKIGPEPFQLERTPSYHLLLPILGFPGNKCILDRWVKSPETKSSVSEAEPACAQPGE